MSLTLITIIWEKKIPPKKCQTLKLYLFHFKTKMIPQMLQEASRSVAASKNNNYLVQDCFFILFKGSIEPDRGWYLVQFYQLLEVGIPGKKIIACHILNLLHTLRMKVLWLLCQNLNWDIVYYPRLVNFISLFNKI